MGADNLINFHKWQKWRQFFKQISIVIFKRHSYNNAALKSIASKTFANYHIKPEKLNGMKLDLDLKSTSLKTDIKSLRKAARQAIAPELMRRANQIIKSEDFKLEDDHKIYWMDNPIAHISPVVASITAAPPINASCFSTPSFR